MSPLIRIQLSEYFLAGNHMETMTWEGDRGIEVSLPMHMLSLVYEPLGNIPTDYRTLYEKAKVNPEDAASVPFVYSKPVQF